MKKALFTFALLLAVLTTGAQTYSVRPEYRNHQIRTDTLDTQSHIFKAGKALKASAYYDVSSWGLAIASGIMFVGPGDADRKVCNALGSVFAAGAIVCKVLSVSLKSKAGTELMLAPGKVTVTF